MFQDNGLRQPLLTFIAGGQLVQIDEEHNTYNVHLIGVTERIKQEEEVNYLGCQMDGIGDPGKELMKE